MATPEIIKAPTKELRLLLRHLRLRASGIKVDQTVPKIRMGRTGLGAVNMTIHPDPLNDQSVVYSFGVGNDVSWDLEMINRFGVTVQAFDPTPGAVQWVGSRQLHEKFVFHPVGIADHDGTIRVYPPPTRRTVHYSSINRAGAREEDGVDVPVKRLQTITRELGDDHIDVLKLDIDGSEYKVVPDVLGSGIRIQQILLEVHHNFRTLKFEDTRNLIGSLREHGFRIYDISHRAREFSFLNVSGVNR